MAHIGRLCVPRGSLEPIPCVWLQVYDLTKFASTHPGGSSIITDCAGEWPDALSSWVSSHSYVSR